VRERARGVFIGLCDEVWNTDNLCRETDRNGKTARPRFLPVAHLVEALHYEPEGRGFDSRWCHWNFSLT
jgi:hypothetical protein